MAAAPLAGRTLGSPETTFAIAEWTEEGGPPGAPRPVAPLHVHHAEDEARYLLQGTLRFRLGDREVEASTGSAVFGPRGVPHTYWNPAPGPARYLIVMGPRTMRLIEELHSPASRTRDAASATYRKHGAELLG